MAEVYGGGDNAVKVIDVGTGYRRKIQLFPVERRRRQAVGAVRTSPDLRLRLVLELRAQIQVGDYALDEGNLARRLAEALCFHGAEPA
jgi:hypothetical protein